MLKDKPPGAKASQIPNLGHGTLDQEEKKEREKERESNLSSK